MDEYLDSNRNLWDEWTIIHRDSDFYDVESFKAGTDRLKPFEIEEVGDVKGKSLLHLQCHFGLDTLAWARRGAEATGVDFSPIAIETAEELARELDIPARFWCSNLYELPSLLDDAFDIVYTSFGVITWLPELDRWADVVDHFLKPGGFFYMAEFHPIAWTLEDADGTTEPMIRYPYFSRRQPLAFEVKGSYADPSAVVEQKVEYGWPHGLGEIVTALAKRGLQLEFLHEYPFSTYRQFPFLVQSLDGFWSLPDDFPGELPFLFSLRAIKEG